LAILSWLRTPTLLQWAEIALALCSKTLTMDCFRGVTCYACGGRQTRESPQPNMHVRDLGVGMGPQGRDPVLTLAAELEEEQQRTQNLRPPGESGATLNDEPDAEPNFEEPISDLQNVLSKLLEKRANGDGPLTPDEARALAASNPELQSEVGRAIDQANRSDHASERAMSERSEDAPPSSQRGSEYNVVRRLLSLLEVEESTPRSNGVDVDFPKEELDNCPSQVQCGFGAFSPYKTIAAHHIKPHTPTSQPEEPLPESVTCERGLSEDADKFSSEFKKQTTPVGLSMISPYATWGRHVHAQPPS